MKFIKKTLFLFFAGFICMGIFSCGKDEIPIVNSGIDSTLDSARFRWKTFQVGNYGYLNAGAWLRDTNDVFVVNNFFGFIARIKNDNIIYTSYSDFVPIQLVGYDKDNAYLFGYNRGEDSSICRIKGWNGSSFEDVTINNNHPIRINRCLYYKPNEVWVAGYDNKIDKFDGNNLTHYQYNTNGFTNFDVENIYFDSLSQKLRFVLLTEIHPPKNSNFLYYIYEFDGNNWYKISEFSNLANSLIKPAYINGYILNKSRNDLKIYTDGNFSPFLNSYGFEFNWTVVGRARNNLLVNGFVPVFSDINRTGLFHWNGKKWSKEYNEQSIETPLIYPVNDNFYFVVQDGLSTDVTTFLIGIKK